MQLYFLAIEKTFIELRGAPLYLSPADWRVARGWHEAGVPLDLVERTLRELFERRAARRQAKGDDAKREPVITLRYCRRAVEAAWKSHCELWAPAGTEDAPKLDLGDRLARLAAALPADLEERELWARRVAGLAELVNAEAVEDALRKLDAELLSRSRNRLGESVRQKLAHDLHQALGVLARRLPEAEVERAKSSLEERLLRQQLELPLLSLFAAETEEVG